MFGRRITLFKLLGFEVRIDMSWIIIAILITWSLAQSVFPHYYKGFAPRAYWVMGVTGALGLFFSIIFHELCHSLVARRFGLPVKAITLFIFGGVAEMEEEPPSARAEFYMAVAGPVSSILLGLGFWGISAMFSQGRGNELLAGVLSYLYSINFILAGFNLIPAFPLDGGRVLRSVLWGWRGRLRWATRISSRIGSGFGLVLIFVGILWILKGAFVGGIWWFLIGLFLRSASQMSYQSLLMRQTLEGERVARFMKPQPITAVSSLSLDRFVEEYLYKYHFEMFPVVDEGKVIGCITTKEIKEIPRQEWGQHTIGNVARPCSSNNTIAPDADVVKALSLMHQSGASRLMVVEGERLVGIIVLKDLLRFLSLKLDLEEAWS